MGPTLHGGTSNKSGYFYVSIYFVLTTGLGLTAFPTRAANSHMGLSAHVSLSKKAAALLIAKREKIIVLAEWFGDPTKAGQKYANESGQISLGAEDIQIPGSGGEARFTGREVNLSLVKWVKNREVQVEINTYTARLSGPKNLIECNFYAGPISETRKKPIQIHCTLINEQPLCWYPNSPNLHFPCDKPPTS
jgi:hypothetical protein